MDNRVKEIKKRDGRLVKYNRDKITEAVYKAGLSVGEKDRVIAEKIAEKVEYELNGRFAGKIPGVEDIQDLVEQVLMQEGRTKTAKSYILYREEHAKLRETKSLIGVEDDIKLSINAIKVLERRYLKKDENRQIVETPGGMFRRVARDIAKADKKYGGDVKKAENEFYELMTSLEFLPNSPTLMNAGKELQQLAACFVLPIEDSMESIFDGVKNTALIHQSGGGTGFSFSRLRPKGDVVKSTGGIASGPVSFMKVFNASTEVIKQGGTRRGANMGILRIDHPDILEFIVAKEKLSELNNFNISVGLTEKFMEAVIADEEYDLVNPRDKKPVKKLSARFVFELIVSQAWKNGEPGIIFLDRINKDNPTPALGEIESTNPCGEQPLLPYEACNLGSINLSKMVSDGKADWEKLKKTVQTAVHFLDNVIDRSKYPLTEIEETVKSNRKIGLGVMGWADMLIKLGIPYNTKEAVSLGEKVMKFITNEAKCKSEELGRDRGSFPNFKKSVFASKHKHMRNATVSTIAPTGTISIIASCSSGIEPIFAVSYIRNVMDGTEMLEVNPLFKKVSEGRGFFSEELMKTIARQGSVQHLTEIPEDVRKVFVTAHDITPDWHIMMQAAFQRHTDNAVSKTVNFPSDATTDEVEKVYLLAYEQGLKGVTIYRDKSRQEQVLNIDSVNKSVSHSKDKPPEKEASKPKKDRSSKCPECGGKLAFMEGCAKCHSCGYSACSV